MPPRQSTRGRPAATTETQVPQENPEPPVEPTVTEALNRMAEAMQYMSPSNCREEHRTETEGDRALERFLRFHPP
jgi:hypothetical protein